MANSLIIRNWSVDEVGRWLASLSLHHLVPKFELANINGEMLSRMDDINNVPPTLKLNPAEKTAIMASVKALKEKTMYRNTLSSTRPMLIDSRTRSTSDDMRKRKSEPFPVLANSLTSSTKEDTHNRPEYKKDLPASEILDEKCTHSGWIRKRGGGYKNWKKRYLVLRLGFAYYYENEYSAKPKGYFSLYNCNVLPCTGEDKIKGFKWVFKVVPEDRNQRTFFVSTAAKHEMEKWIEVLTEEIDRFNISSDGNEDDYEHIYDPVCEDDDDQELEDHTDSPLYEGVDDTNNDEDSDDPYTRIREEFPSPPQPPGSTMGHLSPTHLTWQIADPSKARKGIRDAPIIPPRSLKSLQPDRKPIDPPIAPSQQTLIEEESPYLKIVGNNETISPAPAPSQISPVLPRAVPPQVSRPPPPPPLSPPPHIVPDYPDNGHPLSNMEDEEDPYYIRLQTLEEVLPAHCMFDNISRESAESYLATTGRMGTYLLRDGTHKGAKYILSVLTTTIDSKHYKIYYKEEYTSYCLTEGKMFPSLSQLIEYYKQEDLPKTPSLRLSEPYHPKDH